jgi:hypothetical protein
MVAAANGAGAESIVSIREVDLNTQAGIEYRSVSYVFLESSINTNFRHRPQVNGENGLDYFPHSNAVVLSNWGARRASANGILDIDPRFGHSRGYNTQYSKDSTIQTFLPIPFDFEEVTDYPNRTIYSEKVSEGQRVDMYKRYLTNNYQDIPKHTGEIWDTFIVNDTLYLMTPRATWRTFVNEREALVSNISEVYTGAGGVFSHPAKKIADVGSISQWIPQCMYGQVIVDSLRQKVYLFNGKFQEIYKQGMWAFFNENVKYNYGTNYEDNPVNDNGITGVWDAKYERFILTHLINDTKWTYSYDPVTNRWVSEHSYRKQTYFGFDTKFYSITGGILYKHNDEGNPLPCELDFVANPNPALYKKYNSVNLQMFAKLNGVLKADKIFDTIQFLNDQRNTGVCDLFVELPYLYNVNEFIGDTTKIIVRLTKDNYQFAIPRNRVNPNLDNLTTLAIPQLTNTELDEPIDPMRGNWMLVKLKYSGANRVTIHHVETNYQLIR